MTDRYLAIRRILLPRDTNHRGEVFGGAILAEIDLAGAVEARRHTRHDVATVSVKEVVFKHPWRVLWFLLLPMLAGLAVALYCSHLQVRVGGAAL